MDRMNMMDRSRIDPVHPVNPVKNEPTTETETTEGVFFHRWEPNFTDQGNGHGQDEHDGQEPDRSCSSCKSCQE